MSGTAAAGRTVFTIRNAGDDPHQIAVVYLPDDLPPLDVQLQGATRRNVAPLAGVSSRSPGQTGTFAVDLGPGRYGLLCFERHENGEIHALHGEAVEFHVAEER